MDKRLIDMIPDEDLAAAGITRQELETDPLKALGRIRDEAMNEWVNQEEAIEELVTLARESIATTDPIPGQPKRVSQMAQFYGERLLELNGIEMDAKAIMTTLLLAVFKLAEERNKTAAPTKGAK